MKTFAGQAVTGGEIIVRQRGTKFKPGAGVGIGKDDTLYARAAGTVQFTHRPARACGQRASPSADERRSARGAPAGHRQGRRRALRSRQGCHEPRRTTTRESRQGRGRGRRLHELSPRSEGAARRARRRRRRARGGGGARVRRVAARPARIPAHAPSTTPGGEGTAKARSGTAPTARRLTIRVPPGTEARGEAEGSGDAAESMTCAAAAGS